MSQENIEQFQQEEQQQEEQQDTAQITQDEKPKLEDQVDQNLPIFIQVSDPIEKGSGMQKHVVYAIKGRDALGEFEIYRRFNEFYVLRDVLLANWPGQYIPPIPEKQIGSMTIETTNERVRLLNIFCMKMTQIKHLYYTDEFANIFLRSGNVDISKQLQALSKPSVQFQIDNYKRVFEIYDIKEPPLECIQKMNAVQSFLKKSQGLLNRLYDQAKSLSSARKTLREQQSLVLNAILPEYERLVLTDCVENNKKLIFTNPNNQELSQYLQQLKEVQVSPLDKLQDLITTEQRDLEAFLQAFITRDNILGQKQKVESKLRDEQEELSRVMAGKPTLKGAFSKLSLEEQKQKLEMSLQDIQKEVDLYKLFYQQVTLVLTYKQIDKFKRDKHESYKRIIGDMAKLEMEKVECCRSTIK
ncbi:hypothetical protein pb186bvf_014980 [Paramecium bursaria]